MTGSIKRLLNWLNSFKTGQAVMVCPEVLGGLPIPREPAEIVGGDGRDVWSQKPKSLLSLEKMSPEQFMNGAKLAYQKLHDLGITQLILKKKVLLCGSRIVYDGNFQESKRRCWCRQCLFSTTRNDRAVGCRLAC